MIEYEEKTVSYTPVKIKLTVIKDEVNWEDLPIVTGSFSVTVVKNTGETETLPDVTGSLLNVFQVINELKVADYKVANIVQIRTIHD
jgi:hypothetical protein